MYPNYREIPSPLQAVWDQLDDHFATTPSWFKAIGRVTAFIFITALLVGPYALNNRIHRPTNRAIERAWFRACQFLCGLDLTVTGKPIKDKRVIFASNHVSYLDILVLGGLIDARFVAKSDVASWPVFGFLAKLAGTMFVTRERSKAGQDCSEISESLADGARLILFPEGTSSNGRTVLPFKSALFHAVGAGDPDADITLQPISITYSRYADGRLLTGSLTDLYAWYGDMTLFTHLMNVFGLKGARIEVNFLQPIKTAAFSHRKTLAKAAEQAVRSGQASSMYKATFEVQK